MAEESQPLSIHARIAALNLGQVGRAPVTANGGKPVLEARPSLDERSHSISTPASTHGRATSIGNEPNGPRKEGILPPPTNIVRTGQENAEKPKFKPAPPLRPPQRKESTQLSPALPPRRTSGQLSRKASNESIGSTISTISTISAVSHGAPKAHHSRTASLDAGNRIKAPAYDASSLPPLPPKRTKEDIENRYKDIEKSKAFPGHRDVDRARTALKSAKCTTSVNTIEVIPPSALPALPPRRPSQPALPTRKTTQEQAPPPMPARPSALSLGMDRSLQEPTTNGRTHGRVSSPSPSRNGLPPPPPVPLSSRPDLSKLQPTKPQIQPQAQSPPQTHESPSSCLLCRDFSYPDSHAAKFPRQAVPSLDWLATQLTSPFSHSPTDQARTIFTWLHHNISYDTAAFFGGTVQPSTPMSTLDSGLAVCEGYAGLFTAIASKAGLESIVVGGHGKGFGHSALKPGQPVPPENGNHAWNAVKIDGGEWKLIDTCWGAGHITGAGQPYKKEFSPKQFTMSNEDFGLRHFPSNRSHFFRADGRQVSWEDYIVGEGGGETLQVYNLAEPEGVDPKSFLPKYKQVSVVPSAHAGPTIRFQFSRVCEHWDPIRNGSGKPYVFILAIHGVDGRQDDFMPFETNGMFWWVDVEPSKLGAPGQTISAYTVDSVNGNTGRGLSVEEYRNAKGRKAMGFGGLAAWDLV